MHGVLIAVVAIAAAAILSGCGGEKPDSIVEGCRLFLQGHPEPRNIGAIIKELRANVPEGGLSIPDGSTISVEDLPFDCGGMLVWGCSSPPPTSTCDVRIGYTGNAVDGALIEELGHFMWQNVCGYCESWTSTGGGRDPRFEAWINARRISLRNAGF